MCCFTVFSLSVNETPRPLRHVLCLGDVMLSWQRVKASPPAGANKERDYCTDADWIPLLSRVSSFSQESLLFSNPPRLFFSSVLSNILSRGNVISVMTPFGLERDFVPVQSSYLHFYSVVSGESFMWYYSAICNIQYTISAVVGRWLCS